MGIRGQPRARDAGLDGFAQFDPTGTRLLAAASGPRHTSTSRPARSARGCTSRATGSSPVVGWAERGDGRARRARQLGAALPHHLGHGARLSWSRSCDGPRRSGERPRDLRLPPPRRRARLLTVGTVNGRPRSRPGARTASTAVGRAAARRSGDFGDHGPGRRRDERGHRRQPRPRAAGLARAARRAHRPRKVWPGSPPTSTPDARHHGRRPAVGSSTPTGCGTNTPRDLRNWGPSGTTTAIRISARPVIPVGRRAGPSLPGAVLFPRLRHPRHAPSHHAQRPLHTWFVLTQRIIEKEFALSGSEQNPDLTGKDVRQVLGRARKGAPGPPVEASSATARTSSSPTPSTSSSGA